MPAVAAPSIATAESPLPLTASISSTVGLISAAAISVASRAGRGRQHEPVAHQLVQACGDRDRVVGIGEIAALLQRPTDLEREERVAAGSIVKAHERLLGEARIQARGQQTVEFRRLERREPQVAQAAIRQGPLEIAGSGGRTLRAPCDEQADPLVLQAASDERKHILRRSIEPLDVIDPDDGRTFTRDRAEHTQRSQRHCPLRRLPLRLSPQQRHLERPALRLRKLSQCLLRDLGEQIPQRAIRQLCLRLDRATDKHAVRPIRGRRKPRLPEHGLPDPELTLEYERDRPGLDPVQELAEVPQLLRATDDRLPLCKHPRDLLLRRSDRIGRVGLKSPRNRTSGRSLQHRPAGLGRGANPGCSDSGAPGAGCRA